MQEIGPLLNESPREQIAWEIERFYRVIIGDFDVHAWLYKDTDRVFQYIFTERGKRIDFEQEDDAMQLYAEMRQAGDIIYGGLMSRDAAVQKVGVLENVLSQLPHGATQYYAGKYSRPIRNVIVPNELL
jgi:hypothetical protein